MAAGTSSPKDWKASGTEIVRTNGVLSPGATGAGAALGRTRSGARTDTLESMGKELQAPIVGLVWLETADGDVAEVERDVALLSPLVQREVLRYGRGTAPDQPVVLPKQVSAGVLKLILGYCRFHKVPGRSDKERKIFDEKFIRLDTRRLCELTSAADSLDMKPLVDLTSRALARMIEGKTPEEIRETFHLPDDLTEEEKLEPVKNSTDDPRIRLLNRLYARKRKELQEKKLLKSFPSEPEEKPQDDRSVDDLLSFIEQGEGKSSKAGKAKKKKKGRGGKKEPHEGGAPGAQYDDNEKELDAGQVEAVAIAAMYGRAEGGRPPEKDLFDEANFDDDDGLDPAEREEIDREVEDFNRRINTAWPDRKLEMLALATSSSGREQDFHHLLATSSGRSSPSLAAPATDDESDGMDGEESEGPAAAAATAAAAPPANPGEGREEEEEELEGLQLTLGLSVPGAGAPPPPPGRPAAEPAPRSAVEGSLGSLSEVEDALGPLSAPPAERAAGSLEPTDTDLQLGTGALDSMLQELGLQRHHAPSWPPPGGGGPPSEPGREAARHVAPPHLAGLGGAPAVGHLPGDPQELRAGSLVAQLRAAVAAGQGPPSGAPALHLPDEGLPSPRTNGRAPPPGESAARSRRPGAAAQSDPGRQGNGALSGHPSGGVEGLGPGAGEPPELAIEAREMAGVLRSFLRLLRLETQILVALRDPVSGLGGELDTGGAEFHPPTLDVELRGEVMERGMKASHRLSSDVVVSFLITDESRPGGLYADGKYLGKRASTPGAGTVHSGSGSSIDRERPPHSGA